jgi:hypothetical protein
MAWTNSDGLVVRFGTERADSINSGVNAESPLKSITHSFTYADVADTDTAAPAEDAPAIPAGAVITRAVLYVTDAFVGATGVLDIGLKVAAGTNTDDDGILSTGIATIDVDGDTVVGDGALVASADLTGVAFTENQYLMTTWDTAAFTAGAAKLVVEYMETA